MTQYVRTVEDENDPEPMELPVETDGTILLSTLHAQYPGATGLKYRNPDSGAMRGLRVVENAIQPPDEVWHDYLYVAAYPKMSVDNKRKGEETQDIPVGKTRKVERNKSTDLIVLGLPFHTKLEDMKAYFEQYGALELSEIKNDHITGKSKGFGFVRFKDPTVQDKVVSRRHQIDGRWCDVRYPDRGYPEREQSKKIFLRRVGDGTTSEDLYSYFGQFGEVTDVYIPTPFRGIAFVTFADSEDAMKLLGEDRTIKGFSVHIDRAEPKHSRQFMQRGMMDNNPVVQIMQGYGGGGGGGGGGRDYYSGHGRYGDRSRGNMRRGNYYDDRRSNSYGGGSGRYDRHRDWR
ncbi:TAR DNA-binding protein 43-like isoform X2 [Anneissia japonica]|uniref:TAR DNA-binding protein 43-like isoform X2 n=1 Tax=Anneissia japonica TaxID=1529436 RepID=UPI001425B94D|nr:TAR DNA-binding protein 43-like isoform X2 [Anneissia japonica]XP_033107643.1 TAR DNA-binding protein 43-like isoform X2 [Anneissia japonica]XP_033107644.1 TAR DNA-binding protein 43-like isoform X2 [Anneissia japonica]